VTSNTGICHKAKGSKKKRHVTGSKKEAPFESTGVTKEYNSASYGRAKPANQGSVAKQRELKRRNQQCRDSSQSQREQKRSAMLEGAKKKRRWSRLVSL
jgi:hypothetical protein